MDKVCPFKPVVTEAGKYKKGCDTVTTTSFAECDLIDCPYYTSNIKADSFCKRVDAHVAGHSLGIDDARMYARGSSRTVTVNTTSIATPEPGPYNPSHCDGGVKLHPPVRTNAGW